MLITFCFYLRLLLLGNVFLWKNYIMVYSKSQKELLEYIASTNDICAPYTIIRKIMEITDICVIEFNRKKKEVIFYSSKTGDDMMPQRFIQCLVILDKLERDYLIYIEKGSSSLSFQQYISAHRDIQLKLKVENLLQSEQEKGVCSFCEKFYDTKNPRPIQQCGMRKTNAYELILKYTNAIIYPLPELIEFVKNGFTTPEHIRFEKQLEIERNNHKTTMKWTRFTLIAAVIIPLLVCIIDKCTDTTIHVENDRIKVEQVRPVKTNIISPYANEKDSI